MADYQKRECQHEMKHMQIPIRSLSREVEIPSAELKVNLAEHEYTIPTDAFGNIKFNGQEENIAKFVRVDSETDTSTISKLMTNVWRMQKPNLLISVTGGAEKCNIESELIDAFQYELIKAANSTDAWIITGGTYTGVTKHVGEAAKYYGLTTTNPKCAIIGIAPWGVIQNREALVNEEGSWPAEYHIETEEIRDKERFLDPNHSHFILIDDGTEHEYKTELSIRAKLERKISEMPIKKGDDNVDQINLRSVVSGVPTVLLVLEGGPGTLETVENALKENTPVVIVKGSGRAADILAYAIEYASDDEDNQDVKL
ncbi:hypothetical protein CHS0354_034632 [Potamilus streckersoni]|uniref:TRPM SLOG domain-containing protein n=1 Tax=Potamilus streckersoni TaxID=2493646 RepID=A0AAE0TC06_9BIVA|nr:hypothetical protein CHS0354_034632 [Potamilus streckersoni]